MDQVFQEAVDAGLSYRPTYLEYWAKDAENKAFTDTITRATAAMQSV